MRTLDSDGEEEQDREESEKRNIAARVSKELEEVSGLGRRGMADKKLEKIHVAVWNKPICGTGEEAHVWDWG